MEMVVDKKGEPRCPKCDKSIRYERAHEEGLCEKCANEVFEDG